MESLRQIDVARQYFKTVAITPFTTPGQEIGLSVAESDERADRRRDPSRRR